MTPISFQLPSLTLRGWHCGHGLGNTTLALHGWLDNANTWSQLAPRLNREVIAIDVRGHGHSDWAGDAYHIWDSVLDVHALIAQIGGPVHLLGHSMGAGILGLYAGAFPEDVRSLNLVEGFGPWMEPSLSPRAQLRRAAKQHLNAKTPRPYPSLDVAAQVRASKGVTPVTAEAIMPVVERGMREDAAGFHWRADPWLSLPSPLKMESHQIESCLRAIECPVKIALGEHGMLNPSPMLSERLGWVPQAETRMFSGDHHLHLYPQAATEIAHWFTQPYALVE
ncbi:alpha/beta fold hydrolase [Litorivicinus lipolyticus]|uniref:alpha/beta fold hydrolase n=1 Tax=Litorivicinus lipolyticus TaxID=418701 RepID=UPI003B5A0577